jgi:hypothetical protein
MWISDDDDDNGDDDDDDGDDDDDDDDDDNRLLGLKPGESLMFQRNVCFQSSG